MSEEQLERYIDQLERDSDRLLSKLNAAEEALKQLEGDSLVVMFRHQASTIQRYVDAGFVLPDQICDACEIHSKGHAYDCPNAQD